MVPSLEKDQIHLNWRARVSSAGICFEVKWELEGPDQRGFKGGWGRGGMGWGGRVSAIVW